MPANDCEQACSEAYQDSVKNCYKVLFDGLATAKTDEEKEKCKERFNRCMQLCKDARQACLQACK